MTIGEIELDDGHLSYEIRGEGSPVVLLHGGALTSGMWDDQIAVLERDHTVVRYDARGHGRSSTPTQPFAQYEDLRHLLDGLNLPRASLVGLSMGGRTSIDFAITHPDRVDKLLLVAPGISGMTFRDPFVLDQQRRLAEAGAAGDLAGVVECLLRMWVDGPQRSPGEVAPEIREPCRAAITDNFVRHGGRWHGLISEIGAIDKVAELGARTLALVGDLDSSDIHDVIDLVDRDAPHAHKKVVAGAAHMINLDRPDEFNHILTRFLSH